jgi:hypothetical protein
MTDNQIKKGFSKFFYSIPIVQMSGVTTLRECRNDLARSWICQYARLHNVKPSRVRDLVFPELVLNKQ